MLLNLKSLTFFMYIMLFPVKSQLYGDHNSTNIAGYIQGDKKWNKFNITAGKNIDQFNNQELVDLEWSVKVELSSYYYSDKSRYILNTYKDNDVKRAIKEIINQSL